MFPGIKQRLTKDIVALAPSSMRIKVIDPPVIYLITTKIL